MEKVLSVEDVSSLQDNEIICANGKFSMVKSQITFHGFNNILYIEDGAKLVNARLNFKGNNSCVFIRKTRTDRVNMIMDIYHNSLLFMDKGCSINGNIQIIVSEQCHFIVGKDCMFSSGGIVRNTDAHLLYEIETNKRMNQSRDILIGDHVWIGQNVTIMKAPYIGSGSILGIGTVAKSRVPNNSILSGNPGKVMKKNEVYWDRTVTQGFEQDQIDRYEEFDGENAKKHIFIGEDNTLVWKKKLDQISEVLQKDSTSGKLSVISELSNLPSLVVEKKDKKRFGFFK